MPDRPFPSGFSIEASINYLLLSAFSSGVLLFWTSQIYLQTGMSSLSFLLPTCVLQILLAFMFKLGAAGLHMWVADLYQSISKQLLMYIATAPKLSLFGFWVSAFQHVWNSQTAIGAYAQPAMRQLFAYSTVNEIGLLLLAVETAGFHSLFQHLAIYSVSQLLLWNLSDQRLGTLVAVSLAGLPPSLS